MHLYGFPHPRRSSKSDRQIEQIRADICQCVGQQLEPEQVFTFNGYQLTAINDDGLLRLGRVALRIIDYLPAKPLIKAIAIGATAEAIMGFTYDYRDKYDRWLMKNKRLNLLVNTNTLSSILPPDPMKNNRKRSLKDATRWYYPPAQTH